MSSSARPKRITNSSPWWQRPCHVGWIGLRFFWGTVVLGLAPNASVSLAFFNRGTSLQTLYFWPALGLIQHNIFLVGFIFLVLIGLTGLMRYGSRHREAVPQEQTPAKAPTMRDRTNFLQQLGNIYERRLSKSLEVAIMIEPSLEEWTDISSPSQLISLRLDTPDKRPFPLHTSIVEVYDKAGESLLILGAPGAGKTTLLLKLAIELLSRAKQDPNQPIPVLVDLSSWDSKKKDPSFVIWLQDQLYMDYSLSHDVSSSWIVENKFSFLLDGLDEVPALTRPDCIRCINDFRQNHFVSLVVCSRSLEDPTQVQQLRLPYTVVVQPLALKQVNDFLKRIGKPVDAVRTALQRNPVLRDIVTTPLMLNAVIMAYHGKTGKDLPHLGTEEEQRRQVFERYVERRLEQPTRNWRYSSQETRRWLIWLAQQMQQHHLTKFYLEQLQPTWLPTKRMQKLYTWIFGLILGLVFGLIFGIVVGLVFGMIFVRWSSIEIEPTEVLSWSLSNVRDTGVIWLYGVLVGVLFVGLYGVLVFGLVFGLVLGLFIGLYSVMLFGLSVSLLDKDVYKHSNQGIKNSGLNALRMGLVFGLFGELFSGLILGLSIGLFAGLVYGGASFLNHYLIRFLLYQRGVMPLHYVRFLEEATHRYLLLPVDGGFRFNHQLFQEYFSSLGTAPLPQVDSPPTARQP